MAFNESSPVVNANVSVTSSTISSANINVYCSFTMRKRGSLTENLNISSGVQRISNGQTAATTIITHANVTDTLNGFVYLKNLSTTAGEELIVTLGSTVVGNIPPGAAALIPYQADNDFKTTTGSSATQEYEFLHIYEDTTH
jgi:hypothetical protein|tara:strand:+ start:1040 stop:1465 length:426 start_codon:yes stop_codon:yes gene_type:complete